MLRRPSEPAAVTGQVDFIHIVVPNALFSLLIPVPETFWKHVCKSLILRQPEDGHSPFRKQLFLGTCPVIACRFKRSMQHHLV